MLQLRYRRTGDIGVGGERLHGKAQLVDVRSIFDFSPRTLSFLGVTPAIGFESQMFFFFSSFFFCHPRDSIPQETFLGHRHS